MAFMIGTFGVVLGTSLLALALAEYAVISHWCFPPRASPFG